MRRGDSLPIDAVPMQLLHRRAVAGHDQPYWRFEGGRQRRAVRPDNLVRTLEN